MNQTITFSSDGLYIREKDTIQVISGDQTQQVINVLDLVNGKYDYLKDLGVQVFYFPYGTGVSSSNLKKTIHDSYEANLTTQRQAKPETVKGSAAK